MIAKGGGGGDDDPRMLADNDEEVVKSMDEQMQKVQAKLDKVYPCLAKLDPERFFTEKLGVSFNAVPASNWAWC